MHGQLDIGWSNWHEVSSGFRLQNEPDRVVQQIQIWQIWQPICQRPEFPNNCWEVLAVTNCTKSDKRHIFHQDTSSGPRGPHAVSKVLGRFPALTCPLSKPAVSSLNLQDLQLIPLTSFHPFTVASGSCPCLTAFSHWKRCLCFCWGPQKSSYVPHQALSDDSTASPSTPLHLHHCLNRCLADFTHSLWS